MRWKRSTVSAIVFVVIGPPLAGIDTGIHYPIPVHKQPGLDGHEWRAVGDLSTTERLADEVLSLPLFPELADESVARICAAVERSLATVTS